MGRISVTSRGCSRSFIVLALHRGLRSVQEMYAGGQVISMPLSETMIAGWLSDAYSDARLAAVSLEGLLGGTSFQWADPTTYWSEPKQLLCWWKNNVERRSKFKSLSIDATYDGLDERFIRRANYCECVIDLCISIRNHFDRIIQKNGGTVVIEPIRNEQLNSLLINVLLSDSSHFEDHATFNITASSSSSTTTTTDGCTSNDSSGSEIPSSRGTALRGSRSSGKRRRKQHHIIRRSHSIENEKSNTSSSVVTFASDEDDERENDFMWEPLSLSTEYADAYFMCDEEMILNRALSVSPMAMGGTDRGSSTEVERLLGIVPVDPKNRRVQESKKAHSVEVIEVMSEMTESLSANMTITMDSPLTSPCSTLCLPSASSEAWHSLFSDEGYYGAERAAASGLDCDFGMDLYE